MEKSETGINWNKICGGSVSNEWKTILNKYCDDIMQVLQSNEKIWSIGVNMQSIRPEFQKDYLLNERMKAFDAMINCRPHSCLEWTLNRVKDDDTTRFNLMKMAFEYRSIIKHEYLIGIKKNTKFKFTDTDLVDYIQNIELIRAIDTTYNNLLISSNKLLASELLLTKLFNEYGKYYPGETIETWLKRFSIEKKKINPISMAGDTKKENNRLLLIHILKEFDAFLYNKAILPEGFAELIKNNFGFDYKTAKSRLIKKHSEATRISEIFNAAQIIEL